MNDYLIARLKEGRKASGITQKDVADRLGLKQSTISGYENGTSEPDIDTFIEMCKMYELDYNDILDIACEADAAPMTTAERQLLVAFRQLDKYDKDVVSTLVVKMASKPKVEIQYEPKTPTAVIPSPEYTILRMYGIGPAAGSGNYLPDDIPHGEIQVLKSAATKKADYALKVDGKSMEPKFNDGDIVLVKSQDDIGTGDIGIFAVNGDVLIKQLGNGYLHSLNPDYGDIQVSGDDSVRCLGKVIGKV